MNGLNTCAISGNLTRDPEFRTMGGGMGVLSFTVAVNSARKNRQTGEYEEYPNYIDCTMFGKRAESVQRYLGKGTYVALTGALRWSSWENKDGQKRSKVEVVADELHFENRERPSAPDLYDEDCPF